VNRFFASPSATAFEETGPIMSSVYRSLNEEAALTMKKKPKQSWLDRAFRLEPPEPPIKDKTEEVILQPALRQIGITDCPICKHEIAVYLTKTHRPFINCSFCSARIFYNGRESMRLLKKKMRVVEDE
jgi:DNA-directed RNA polymerase subunit RPC12/RpoP